jgi:hypothetical protein
MKIAKYWINSARTQGGDPTSVSFKQDENSLKLDQQMLEMTSFSRDKDEGQDDPQTEPAFKSTTGT